MASNRRQKGISAVEFALAFPLMFLIFYGIVTYALVFLVQHTISNTVAESARSLLRFQSSQNDTVDVRIAVACESAQRNLRWLISMNGNFLCGSNASGNFFLKIQQKNCSPGGLEDYVCFQLDGAYYYQKKPLIPNILPVPLQLNSFAETQVKLKI